MKRLIALFLCLCLFLSLTACAPKEVTPPTCEQLIAAYKEAGYHVFHHEDCEAPQVCYVKIWLEDEYDYIYFEFFETAKDAEDYAATRQYNAVLYLFSVIYGDPSWLYTETCGNIEYEYCNKDLLKPFEELIK